MQSFDKVCLGSGIDDNILQIAEAYVPEEVGKDQRHQSAECGWRSVKSKWHAGELEQPVTDADSGAFHGTLSHTELPISTKKVERGKIASSARAIQSILYVKDSEGILTGHGINWHR